jgi:hypothetical protein
VVLGTSPDEVTPAVESTAVTRVGTELLVVELLVAAPPGLVDAGVVTDTEVLAESPEPESERRNQNANAPRSTSATAPPTAASLHQRDLS